MDEHWILNHGGDLLFVPLFRCVPFVADQNCVLLRVRFGVVNSFQRHLPIRVFAKLHRNPTVCTSTTLTQNLVKDVVRGQRDRITRVV